MFIILIETNKPNGNKTMKWTKRIVRTLSMKFCYIVQSDNTLMDCGYDSTWMLLKIDQVNWIVK